MAFQTTLEGISLQSMYSKQSGGADPLPHAIL